MKTKLTAFLFSVCLCIPCFGGAAHVTSLGGTAAQIVVPSVATKVIILHNTGSNTFRYTIDGGASYTDPNTGKAGTNPTTTLGDTCAPGERVVISTFPGPTTGSPSPLHAPIAAIMVSGSTTIEVLTDDGLATFPTS